VGKRRSMKDCLGSATRQRDCRLSYLPRLFIPCKNSADPATYLPVLGKGVVGGDMVFIVAAWRMEIFR
jgi:hypothetical protein